MAVAGRRRSCAASSPPVSGPASSVCLVSRRALALPGALHHPAQRIASPHWKPTTSPAHA
jgi:hypothetical protein